MRSTDVATCARCVGEEVRYKSEKTLNSISEIDKCLGADPQDRAYDH